MTSSLRKGWQSIAYPYSFALRQGHKIKQDPMDYSLMMMLVTAHETLTSPVSKELGENASQQQFPLGNSSSC